MSKLKKERVGIKRYRPVYNPAWRASSGVEPILGYWSEFKSVTKIMGTLMQHPASQMGACGVWLCAQHLHSNCHPGRFTPSSGRHRAQDCCWHNEHTTRPGTLTTTEPLLSYFNIVCGMPISVTPVLGNQCLAKLRYGYLIWRKSNLIHTWKNLKKFQVYRPLGCFHGNRFGLS